MPKKHDWLRDPSCLMEIAQHKIAGKSAPFITRYLSEKYEPISESTVKRVLSEGVLDNYYNAAGEQVTDEISEKLNRMISLIESDITKVRTVTNNVIDKLSAIAETDTLDEASMYALNTLVPYMNTSLKQLNTQLKILDSLKPSTKGTNLTVNNVQVSHNIYATVSELNLCQNCLLKLDERLKYVKKVRNA